MKKTLLLLWKTVLLTLGPLSGLFELKNRQRRLVNLPELQEDTHIVIRQIRANSPPANPVDNITNRPIRNNNRHAAIGHGTQGPHQGSLAGGRLAVQQQIAQQQLQQQLNQRQMQRRWNPNFNLNSNGGGNNDDSNKEDDALGTATPRPGSPVRNFESSTNGENDDKTSVGAATQFSHSVLSKQLIAGIMNSLSDVKVLPWRPKVRTSDIEVCLLVHISPLLISLAYLPRLYSFGRTSWTVQDRSLLASGCPTIQPRYMVCLNRFMRRSKS